VWRARGADPTEVMGIFAQDRKLNISPVYLRPGFAFGGSCLPKDVRAITSAAHGAAIPIPLLDSILPSNDVVVRRAVDSVLETGKRNVALLGLAFKAGTDDLRESPLLELAKRLIGEGMELTIHDAFVSLAKLHGTNRAFLEQRIPHITRLLRDSVEDAVEGAEVVVIGHGGERYDRDDEWRAQGKIVLRLT
jgi:GDP-mannose 6-dehydrogenase